MKKIAIIVIPILFIFSLVFFINNDNENPDKQKNLPEPGNNQSQEEDEETKINTGLDDNQDKTSDQSDDRVTETDDINDEQTEKEQTKYFINKKYFVKPVNPEDENKVVLLTFDDAPQGNFTNEILDILDKYQAKAIFFINGHYAVKHEELVKEIYDRGHIIGNHTWWHEDLRNLNLDKTIEEIIKLNDLVEEITGERPQFFRPPFGVMSDFARKVIEDEHMQSFNWSLGSLDWEYPKPEQNEKVIAQVINNLHNGANILMHDKEVTALALEQILAELTEQGYTFVLPTEIVIENNM